MRSVLGRRDVLLASASAFVIGLLGAGPAQAIIINDAFTPAQVVDTTNITGIGQMVVDEGNGFVGVCTATLINPRTVLFAAHCVNDAAANTYGAKFGGQAIGFGFQADDRAGVSAWLAGAGKYKTNTSLAFYNANYVTYNPRSLDVKLGNPPEGFLTGDLAMAAIDTPASKIPAWTLLFSPLATPTTAPGAAGTGYHVAISGYGTNGTGTTGQAGGIDFRRRSAENMLGILGSLDDQDQFLFGDKDALPQNLYQIDFDDPKRGMASANRFDFNIFRDNALTREGLTAPGDSGGPLIIDQAFSKPIVIGVLSGGDRFFNAQPGASYGTTAFYQPLYLFWDWIVANNPYRYVAAAPGDGRWTDPAHWINTLDPAYQVLGPDGQPTSGLPSTTPAGVTGTTPKFGQLCLQDATSSSCLDLATGQEQVTTAPLGKTGVGSRDAVVEADGSMLEAAAINTTGTATPIPGLPGSVGVVPNNTDGAPATNIPARYYDVTLSAMGATTLDAAVEIDRLRVSGAAGLSVTSVGVLSTMIDITQTGGSVAVDGRLSSVGDYALIAGLLRGTGRISAPFVTSVAGVIAPGAIGTIGRLTIAGDVVLASGSQLAIDLGPAGASDQLVVEANAASGAKGALQLGGMLALSGVGGYRPRYGDRFTVATASGGVQGGFNAVAGFSGVLFPQIVVSAGSVGLQIAARPYADLIDPASPVQRAYASLLDTSRPAYGAMSTLYGELDLLNAPALRPTLEAMAPHAETTRTSLATMQQDGLSRLYRQRMREIEDGEGSGTLAVIGQPLLLAQTDAPSGPGVRTEIAGVGSTRAAPVRLPDGLSAFVASGYLDGSAAPLASAFSSGYRDQLSAWYAAGGVEARVSSRLTLGAAFGVSSGSGRLRAVSRVDSDLYQAAAYGTYRLPGQAFISAQGAVGAVESVSKRSFQANTVGYALTGRDRSPAMTFEVEAGKALHLKRDLTLTPIGGLRYRRLEVGPVVETGGDAALAFARRNVEGLEARFGGELAGAFRRGRLTIAPHLNAAVVHDLGKRNDDISADFVFGSGGAATFKGPVRSSDWGEVGGGLRISSGRLAFDASADTNIGRSDLDYQSYRASLSYRF